MAKKIIRLTESDLHNMVRGAVRKALRESEDWKNDFHSWADSHFDIGLSPEERDARYKKSKESLDKAFPKHEPGMKSKRRQALKAEFDKRDAAKGKTRDKKGWGKDYDDYFRGNDDED